MCRSPYEGTGMLLPSFRGGLTTFLSVQVLSSTQSALRYSVTVWHASVSLRNRIPQGKTAEWPGEFFTLHHRAAFCPTAVGIIQGYSGRSAISPRSFPTNHWINDLAELNSKPLTHLQRTCPRAALCLCSQSPLSGHSFAGTLRAAVPSSLATLLTPRHNVLLPVNSRRLVLSDKPEVLSVSMLSLLVGGRQRHVFHLTRRARPTEQS